MADFVLFCGVMFALVWALSAITAAVNELCKFVWRKLRS